MQFKVRALTKDQYVVIETINAVDETQARQEIKSRGWFVSSIQKEADNRFPSLTGRALNKWKSTFSLLLFSKELLALLQAGLTIVESLEALVEKEKNEQTQNILMTLLAGVREGKRFSQTLHDQPTIFTALFIGIIQASERTSSLPSSLSRFIQYQERIDIIKNKIVSAMIYPTILLAVGGSVTIFLMTYVVPKFADVYKGTGREMPWSSQLLLDWGNFVAQHSSTLIVSLLGLVIIGAFYLHRSWKNGEFMELVRNLPGLSESFHIYYLSRLYLTLGMLLDGGIPIVTALTTVEKMLTSTMKQNLHRALQAIESGISLSDAFENNQLTTPISQRLLRVGERTGELGKMLTESANFYEGEISRWIDRFIRGFEPLLMAAIGLIVGTIVVLLYMPIFNLADGFS
ncbi:type II secretion system F family protein [Undibacterium sp. Dicai25W]|uniref:type II secretion system F family protein n=1 Tax=Undibacterium sp. Dicai25W TaxID=3413034 RepID=UPI003BF249F2